MIEVTIDRKALSIEARGHAKAQRNEYGHDLVCAAVSMLMQAFAYAGMRTGHSMEVDMDKGHMHARIDPDTTATEQLRAMFDAYVWGLMLAAENYPQNVRILEITGV